MTNSPENQEPTGAAPETPEPPPTEPSHAPAGSKDGRNMAMFCHLSALLGFVGVPFGNIIGPLVIWLLKREEYPEVDEAGKEALNFQISMIIYGVIAAILILVVIGFVLMIALVVFDIVMIVIAAIKTSSGEKFRYPLTIRLIK